MRDKKKNSAIRDMAQAEYEAMQEIKVKNKQPITRNERRGTLKVDVLLGDQKAAVTRGRTIKRSIPFGEASISATCNVYLTCNQDVETIKRASQAAMDIAMDVLREQDAPDMEAFINQSMKMSIKNRKSL